MDGVRNVEVCRRLSVVRVDWVNRLGRYCGLGNRLSRVHYVVMYVMKGDDRVQTDLLSRKFLPILFPQASSQALPQ